MSIFDKIVERMGYTKAVQSSGGLRFIPPDMGYQDTATMYNQSELYRRLSWVFTAVNIPSNIASTVPLNVRKIRGEKTSDVDNHPFEMLLKQPNPNQSRMEFIKDTVSYWLLTGNSYWHMARTSENAPPAELWNIPPDRIKRIITDGNQLVTGYEYDSGEGGVMMIPAWQVIHFKDFHPNSVFSGLSRVETIAIDASTDINTSKWVNQLYGKNNARLPGILAFADAINDTDWDTIQKDARDAAEKRQIMMLRNTGKGAINWLQASGTLQEMEYINGRTFTKEEIFSVFAPGLASMLAVNATEANSRTGKATLVEFCIWPMLVMIAEKITASILPAYVADKKQLSLIAEFDDIRITDRALELSEIAEFAKTHTVDEVRERYYEDKPLATITGIKKDKRGIMFVAQISSGTPAPSDDKEDDPKPAQPIPPQLVQAQQQPFQEDEQPEEEPQPNQAQEDMAKWQRKALKALKAGKPAAVEFVSDLIPADEHARITESLQGCTTEAEVKAVFISPRTTENMDGLKELVGELARLWKAADD